MCNLAAMLPRKHRAHGFQGAAEIHPPSPPTPRSSHHSCVPQQSCAPAVSLPHHLLTGVPRLVISSLECEVSDSDAPRFYPLPLWLMVKLEWRTLLAPRALNRQRRTLMLRSLPPSSHALSNIVDMHAPTQPTSMHTSAHT